MNDSDTFSMHISQKNSPPAAKGGHDYNSIVLLEFFKYRPFSTANIS